MYPFVDFKVTWQLVFQASRTVASAVKCFIVQLWTYSIEMYRATARYGAILRCSYRTVHVYTYFTSKHVFLVCSDETHKFYIVTYVSSCCRINTLFTEYRETSLVWCRIICHSCLRHLWQYWQQTHDLSLYSVNNIYMSSGYSFTMHSDCMRRVVYIQSGQ